MKLPDCIKPKSARPPTAGWLVGVLLVFLFSIPSQAFAACSGSAGIANDGNDLNGNGVPDYVFPLLPASVNWTLTPAAGDGSDDIDVDFVRFGLSCFNNGDSVPCANGNDGQAGNGALTPLQFGSLTGGTCNASVFSNAAGVVTFQLPDAVLTEAGCTIEFSSELQDYGNDASPNFITPAVAFDGTCVGAQEGSAAGSDSLEVVAPSIDITKRVWDPTVPGWVDANDPTGPFYPVGAVVSYQLEVCNDGDVDLEDVIVEDAQLGIGPISIGALAADDCTILEEGQLSGLDSSLACAEPGLFTNTAFADGFYGGNTPVEDDDPANVTCVPPSIDITKRVWDPTIPDWVDANSAPGPSYVVGSVVSYQLEVCNDGEVDLEDVIVEDGDLGIGPISIGALAVGQCTILEEGHLSGLDSSLACENPGLFTNTAFADGFYGGGLGPVEDDDPANVECLVPSIDITKRVWDPTIPDWVDANDPTGPFYPVGAVVSYQLEVCNDGEVDLEDVIVEDAQLGIGPISIGALAAGDCTILEDGDLSGLDSSLACAEPGLFTNTAFADGFYGGGLGPVEDDDPANVTCLTPDLEVTKNGQEEAKIGDEIVYVICAENTGDVDLANCTGVDTFLTLDPFGDLAPGEESCQDVPYTIPEGADDPLLNEVEVTCDVVGTADTVNDNDNHSVDLFTVSAEMSKECRPDPVRVGGTIEWEITINNTGEKDILCLVDDDTAGFTGEPLSVPAGTSDSLMASRPVVDGDGETISNTATANCEAVDYTNVIEPLEASADCEVERAALLCRTPGFWKNRAGEERGGRNITGEVIASETPPGLMVCGEYIASGYDAMQAMCGRMRDGSHRQLVRQLTAGVLNCRLGVCTTDLNTMLANCNAFCEGGVEAEFQGCIDEIDCFNNGGIWDGAMCIYGTGECAITGEDCSGMVPCPMVNDLPQQCDPDPTCHDDGNLCEEGAEFCFEPVRRNSSPKECRELGKDGIWFPDDYPLP